MLFFINKLIKKIKKIIINSFIKKNNDNIANVPCCFCKKNIKINEIDPCDLNILTNWHEVRNKRINQAFLCHIACLKKNMHPNVRNYVMIDL